MICPTGALGIHCDCDLWKDLSCAQGSPIAHPLNKNASLLCTPDMSLLNCVNGRYVSLEGEQDRCGQNQRGDEGMSLTALELFQLIEDRQNETTLSGASRLTIAEVEECKS